MGNKTTAIKGQWIGGEVTAGVLLCPSASLPAQVNKGGRLQAVPGCVAAAGISAPTCLVRVLLPKVFRPYTRTTSNEIDEENEPWPCEKWTALSFGTSRSRSSLRSLQQFLVEAVMLCLLGGAVGL